MGDFVQNSPLLVPKYFHRQKNTILSSKKIPTENVAKKEGGLCTEFNIPSSKYFQTQENTISRSKIFPTKNIAKREEVFRTEFTIINSKLTYKRDLVTPMVDRRGQDC